MQVGSCMIGKNSNYKLLGKPSGICAPGGAGWTNRVWTTGSINPTPVTAEWSDQECWIDNASRTIPLSAPSSVSTLDECQHYALTQGKNIASMQNGIQCFVGLNDNYKKLGSVSGICKPNGDALVNHVYTIGPVNIPS